MTQELKQKIEKVLAQLTVEEKAALLTGGPASLSTAGIERLGIKAKRLADGPHGQRNPNEGSDCTLLPSCCATAATWNDDLAYLMGQTIANDCVHNDIQMILGPGVNIKRNALNGRNFEYFSEDPYLTGKMTAAYVNGCEENGVGTSVKHLACNSQETRRTFTSAEVDERTLREIYLKAFEIAVQESKPTSIMCAYNKINSIWCGEHKQILDEIPRGEWGYEGIMISDWGAVHNAARSILAGLDLRMPGNTADTVAAVKEAMRLGKLSEEDLDRHCARVLEFLLREVRPDKGYDREKQHQNAVAIAEEAICLLKNDNILPLSAKKMKKIAVTGEYAVEPYLNGQGSAEVYPNPEHIDSPYECLKRALPDVQVDYLPHLTKKQPDQMLWPKLGKEMPDLESYDAVLVFTGVQPSQDSENMDRFDNRLAGYIEHTIGNIYSHNPNVVLVLTGGCSTFKSDNGALCPAIVQMWPTGEGAGQAIANVLTGKVNPSGKLSETFPTEMRRDIDLNGDGQKIEYNEKWAVGYRYYDLHPEEIWFAFGHGLSYTTFEYSNPVLTKTAAGYRIAFDIKNTGKTAGKEVAQLYIGDPVSTVSKPVKELKRYAKVLLEPDETKTVTFEITPQDFSYYNISLHEWIAESGRYDLYIGASSRDIRLTLNFDYQNPDCYTMERLQGDMIG